MVRASSAGLLAAQPYSDLSFSVTARTSDGTGSGWASGSSRRLAEVDFAQLARADGVSSELSSSGSSEVRVPSLRTHDFLLASKSDAV